MASSDHPKDFGRIDPASRIQSASSTKKLNDKLDEQRTGHKNDPASRWQRGGVLAGRLADTRIQPEPAVYSSSSRGDDVGDGDRHPEPSGKVASSSFIASKLPFTFKSKIEENGYIEDSRLLTKKMEAQNYLEMLDPRHRYGSNLKHYHRYWNLHAETDQNFLHWLDDGDGRDLSGSVSKIERCNYMTFIDTDPCPPQEVLGEQRESDGSDDVMAKLARFRVSSSIGRPWNAIQGKGRLRWCKTGELVSTSEYEHGDLGQGRGVALRGSKEWQAAVCSGEAADIVRSDQVKVRRPRRQDSDSSSASYTSWNESDLSAIEHGSSTYEGGSSGSEGGNSRSEAEPRPVSAPKPSLDEKHQSKREKWWEKANLGPKYWAKHKLGLYAAKDRQQHVGCQGKEGEEKEEGGDGDNVGNNQNDYDPDAGVADSQGDGQGDNKAPSDAVIRRKKADTWLFVADLEANLYIGIKTHGRFQHSSFLSGSIVAAAGILKVKDGIIISIYPWSGHYRSGGDHFEALVDRLRAKGLNTSGINVRKSKLVIEGVNRYGRYRKAKDRKKLKIKDKARATWDAHFRSGDRGEGAGPKKEGGGAEKVAAADDHGGG